MDLAQNCGLSPQQLNTVLRVIREREDNIRKAWKAHFGS
jgi:hypothetical protein